MYGDVMRGILGVRYRRLLCTATSTVYEYVLYVSHPGLFIYCCATENCVQYTIKEIILLFSY